MVGLNNRVWTHVDPAGDEPGDLAGHEAPFYWLIDVATPLNHDLPDGWTAHRYGNELSKSIAASLDTSLHVGEILRRSLALIDHKATIEGNHERATFPSAAIALLRTRSATAEVILLGDVRVVARASSGDTCIDSGEDYGLEQVRKALRTGASPEQAYALVLTELKERRRTRNTEDGVWVARREPEAVQHALFAEFEFDRAALLTDGAWRLLDPFAIVSSPLELLDCLASPAEAQALLARLRKLEESDRSRTLYHRYRVHDDAAVLVLERI